MERSAQTAIRLLAALEELLLEETSHIRTMDFGAALNVRERGGPLVERLCTLANEPGVSRLHSRVAALVGRWDQNYDFLRTQMHRLQGELNQVNESRGRLRRLAPVYLGATGVSESRLNTAA